MAKTRSPNFPFIPLDTAVQRARVVWDKEGRHPAAPETIVGHWRYSAKSSGGRQTIAALRQFGLMEGRGSADLRLTELAQAILFSEEGSEQWLTRVREAALKPAIHQEIWHKYEGQLPSDQNLRYYLVVERGFSETGASELIQELRATFAYAQMGAGGSDNLSLDPEDKTEAENQMSTVETPLRQDPPPPPSGSRRTIQLPYSGTDWAVLQASFPLTDKEWEQMIAVLKAMKPALVARSSSAQEPQPDE